ncbi:hypothetical protein M5K25_003588 [Dendrobium thyrsiflorum]|uniref:Uncharacterized protein n=1 Tax=Dendrobium thyrsiflorum TaxID=117978 RepID=A0ABD0VKW8_DENTH
MNPSDILDQTLALCELKHFSIYPSRQTVAEGGLHSKVEWGYCSGVREEAREKGMEGSRLAGDEELGAALFSQSGQGGALVSGYSRMTGDDKQILAEIKDGQLLCRVACELKYSLSNWYQSVILGQMAAEFLKISTTTPATSEVRGTNGDHGRRGNPNLFKGRENPDVDILEGEDGMSPLELLSREKISTGFNRRPAEFARKREDFYHRGADFERGRGEYDEGGRYDRRREEREGVCFKKGHYPSPSMLLQYRLLLLLHHFANPSSKNESHFLWPKNYYPHFDLPNHSSSNPVVEMANQGAHNKEQTTPENTLLQ